MSYNRAYAIGEKVMVDQGVVMGVPTLGPCTDSGTVLAASNAAEAQVYLVVDGYPPLYVYKDRIQP